MRIACAPTFGQIINKLSISFFRSHLEFMPIPLGPCAVWSTPFGMLDSYEREENESTLQGLSMRKILVGSDPAYIAVVVAFRYWLSSAISFTSNTFDAS